MPRQRHPLPDSPWPTAEEAGASRLFSPVTIGSMELSARTWVPAMVPWRATEEGFVTPQVLEWYGRFADGQPGAIVVEATGVRDVPSGPLLRIGHDRFLPGLRDLVEVVRERSQGKTRLLIQVIDFLRIRKRPQKERFLREFLVLGPHHRAGFEGGASDEQVREALVALPHDELLERLDPREAEAMEMGARERVDDLNLAHVRELPQVLPGLFADAAGRAQQAGFDGVELHYAHAYTMASFLSRRNQRDDGYGQTREGRLRLPLEVYRAVRERVGSTYPVGCRFLGDEVIEGGSRLDDAQAYALAFAEAGMDFLSVSKGGKFEDARQPQVGQAAYPYTGESGHECMPTVFIDAPGPFGRNLPLARGVRETLQAAGRTTPVIGAGGIGTYREAEQALERGDCDLVAAARQSLADPDWWKKVRLGRGEEVRRCIFTNYCEGLDQRHKQVTCQLWDRELDEQDAAGGRSMSSDGKRRLLAPPWAPS